MLKMEIRPESLEGSGTIVPPTTASLGFAFESVFESLDPEIR